MKKIRLNKKPVPAMLQSKSYVGVSCVDGTCPKARADDYEEYSAPVGFNCDDCWLYKGCEDCALYGTNECEEAKEK